MTDQEIQSLKELLCFKISALEKLMNEKFDSADDARILQAKEYERRLTALNHEADQLKSMQSTYLPRESYDIAHKELNKKVDILQSFKDNLTGRMVIIPVIISITISVIFVLINYFLMMR